MAASPRETGEVVKLLIRPMGTDQDGRPMRVVGQNVASGARFEVPLRRLCFHAASGLGRDPTCR